MFRGKIFERESYYFGVLNEFLLKNFWHGWVVNRETNLTSLINPWLVDGYCSITVAIYGLSRLIRFVSRFTIYSCKKFWNRLHLILHACDQICDVIFLFQKFLASKHGRFCLVIIKSGGKRGWWERCLQKGNISSANHNFVKIRVNHGKKVV